MKKRAFFILLMGLTFYQSHAQVLGCTDTLASNFNSAATKNDGSCLYANVNMVFSNSVDLPDTLLETSGLARLGSDLWTFNDGGNSSSLYRLNSNRTNLSAKIRFRNRNIDWEDLAVSNSKLFLGDFGNNGGNRQNLKIYIIDRVWLERKLATNPFDTLSRFMITDSIRFSYADQSTFNNTSGAHNFDCEAMVFYNDSIHLFSKNWVDLKTRHYVIPAKPGTYSIKPRETLDAKMLVTGASVSPSGLLALIGYIKTIPYSVSIWLLHDFHSGRFFNGNKRKIGAGSLLNAGQAEGICFTSGTQGFITNEKITQGPVTIKQASRKFDVSAYLPKRYQHNKPEAWLQWNVANAPQQFQYPEGVIGQFQLLDKSTFNPTTWKWTVPNTYGANYNEQNPSPFPNEGPIEISLKVSNAYGSDSVTVSGPIGLITSTSKSFQKADPFQVIYKQETNSYKITIKDKAGSLLTLRNITGQVIDSWLIANDVFSLESNFSYPKGVYVLSLESSDGFLTRKLMLNK